MVTIKDRYLALSSAQVLPFLDGIFAVAFTLMAYSIPEELRGGREGLVDLVSAIGSFLLCGVAVLLYWFKMRRLVQIAGELYFPQLSIGFLGLLTIVALPKMSALALRYGQGEGSLSNWTTSQAVNTLYLGVLCLFDLLVLLFALSLLCHPPCRCRYLNLLKSLVCSQVVGFVVLSFFGVLELFVIWFNAEYVFLVPFVLLLEEVVLAQRFARAWRSGV